MRVMIVGDMYNPDLSVGGGPVYPPANPPGIWGGMPWPTPPIYYPPASSPGYPAHPIFYPPGIWGPSDPRPNPPIYLPPVQPTPPPDNAAKPPPPEGGWGYHPEYGWGYFPPKSDKPQPGPTPPTATPVRR